MTVTIAPETAFVFLLVFARLGTMVMALPALGDLAVSPRVRLLLALAMSVVMLPIVRDAFGTIPSTLWLLFGALGFEIMIGAFVGLSARLIMTATQVAGTVIAFQTGLAFAQNVDPTQGVQSALFGNFLSLLAATLIFTLDLHHLLIQALHDSYILFKPGTELPWGDFAQMALQTVAASFRVGIQLAAPFLIMGLIFYLGIGVLSRLMPQVQIFFIAMPANIMLGFILLMFLLSAMMMWFFDHFEASMVEFLQP